MAVFKCKMCGGKLEVVDETSVCECEYCGSKQTIPTIDDEKIIKLYDRANRLRMSNEFDKAMTVYESIIEESDIEAEAYWGLILCKYGIEYVDDPATGDKIPTCHRSSFDSVMKDSDFEMVMENADAISKAVYREQAKQIEEIRKGIIEVSGKEQPYDIFICYKETAEDGKRTIDSVIAQDVYDELTDKGYRVFFSRISLEDKLGTEYEPYIFAALNSAKIMLAFGTSYDYYNAAWVKNEWSRFIKLMAKDKSKYLIPCYKDIDAYDMPEEFARLQAQDMGKVGAIQDLVRGIDKLTGRTEKAAQAQNPQTTPVTQQVIQGGGTNLDALLQRGYMALEDKEWEKADEFFEQVLNQNAQSVDAYLGKLLAECQVTSQKKLARTLKRFDRSKNYKKILKFADETLKSELENALKSIDKNIENDRIKQIYKKAIESRNKEAYKSAVELFSKITDYEDSQKQLDECKELAEEQARKAEEKAREAEERAREFNKKLDSIAKMVERHGKQSSVEVLKNKIDNTEARINTLNQEALALQNLAEMIPSIDAENIKLKTDRSSFENKMEKLNQELNGLGIFAGKRKKEIAIEIEDLRFLIKKKDEAINLNILKKKGYDSGSIRSKIEEYANKTQKIINELEDMKGRLKDELNNPDRELNYDEAMKLLENNVVADAFARKYPDLDFIIKNNLVEGTIITLGKYKNQSIEWRVLRRQGKKYLLFADKALEVGPYDDEYTHTTWEKCALRQWLNNGFINLAFSSKEKRMIAPVNVTATKNPKFNTDAGNDTKDKVFLLSIDEAMEYFKDDSARQCLPADSARDAYKSDGRSLYCYWWLRSPGNVDYNTAGVLSSGMIHHAGERVTCKNRAIRPAIWIDLVKLRE